MRAKYIGSGVVDNYKGISLRPGCEFDVPESMKVVVQSGPTLFQILNETTPVKRGPGRPRKSDENEV